MKPRGLIGAAACWVGALLGAGDLPADPKDHLPLLVGPVSAADILAHRAVFRDNTAKMRVPEALQARWQAIHRPLTLVAVFGSWCSDSQVYLPNLLTLEAHPSPFIEVHFVGVARDKQVAKESWPAGCAPQVVQRVPTFYLFASQPGGGQALVGTVVEHPPRASQTMGEALVELVEAAARP